MTVDPVAIVHNTRTVVEDDDWGAVESRLELADEIPREALDGIETFSHVEVLQALGFGLQRPLAEPEAETCLKPEADAAARGQRG